MQRNPERQTKISHNKKTFKDALVTTYGSSSIIDMHMEHTIHPDGQNVRRQRLLFWSLGLALLLICFGLIWNTFKRLNQTQYPIPTIISTPRSTDPIDRTQWAIFKDEHVEYKYPKSWIQTSEIPSSFQTLMQLSRLCTALMFQDPDNDDMLLVVENYPQPLQQYRLPCWSKGSVSSLTPHSRSIKRGNKEDVVNMSQLSSASSTYTLEQYGFESDFTTVNAYMVSVLFKPDNKVIAEPVIDGIIASFTYVKQYKVREPKEWKTYTSKLGFSFTYPTEWGEIQEEIINHGNNPNTGQSGKSYRLTFSIQSKVGPQWVSYGVGKSSDYTAARGAMFTDYSGNPNKPTSVTSEITSGLTYRCYQYQIQYNPYKGVIRFNMPGKEIGGVMLVVPILSLADMEYYDKIVNDFVSQEDSCNTFTGVESSLVISKEKEITDMLYKGVNYNEESNINLAIFKRILESARIL